MFDWRSSWRVLMEAFFVLQSRNWTYLRSITRDIWSWCSRWRGLFVGGTPTFGVLAEYLLFEIVLGLYATNDADDVAPRTCAVGTDRHAQLWCWHVGGGVPFMSVSESLLIHSKLSITSSMLHSLSFVSSRISPEKSTFSLAISPLFGLPLLQLSAKLLPASFIPWSDSRLGFGVALDIGIVWPSRISSTLFVWSIFDLVGVVQVLRCRNKMAKSGTQFNFQVGSTSNRVVWAEFIVCDSEVEVLKTIVQRPWEDGTRKTHFLPGCFFIFFLKHTIVHGTSRYSNIYPGGVLKKEILHRRLYAFWTVSTPGVF